MLLMQQFKLRIPEPSKYSKREAQKKPNQNAYSSCILIFLALLEVATNEQTSYSTVIHKH